MRRQDDLYFSKQLDPNQNTVQDLLYSMRELKEFLRSPRRFSANAKTQLNMTVIASAARCRAAILWHAEHGQGILNTENLKHRVAARLDVMQISGLISDEVFSAAHNDVYSDDCEMCGERSFTAIERDVPEEGEVGEHYYTKYVICEKCMDASEHRAAGPDPDDLYDHMREREADRWERE